jgi:hypothetical protein
MCEMKGYVFALGPSGDVERIVRSGLFGTIQRPEIIGGSQEIVFLETTADYLTIAPGDKVFFFQNRKIYGVGEVIDIFGTGGLPVLQ